MPDNAVARTSRYAAAGGEGRQVTARRTAVIGAGVAAVLAAAMVITGPVHGRAVVEAAPRSTPSASTSTSAPGRPVLLPPVLEAASPTPAAAAGVAARIAAVGGIDDTTVEAAVWSAGSGRWVYDQAADTAIIPASTNKLLTCAAALHLLGPMHRFTTSVVALGGRTPSTPGAAPTIVLVGGGDPYLAGSEAAASVPGQASLETLAARTAARLRKEGTTAVRLGYDASLFTGPAWNSQWPAAYSTSVTPTSALWADEGRIDGSGHRQQDPAAAAARLFAGQLRRLGIKVVQTSAAAARLNPTAIASVSSLPLSRIVERTLMTSDNDAAEVILRQVAIGAGRPGSITDGVRTVQQTLTTLGVWADTARSYDGSGLARTDRLPPRMLADILRLAASGRRPALAPLLTGLPVAGVEGSLHYRFGGARTAAGAGLVRAKTGTLHGVRSLAGYAYTRDGELLIFALILNEADHDHHKKTWGQRAVSWLDRTATAVAGCGCRS